MSKNIICAILFILLTIASSSGCGSSSGNRSPDTMTVTISSPSGSATTTTYTEGSYSTNSTGNSGPNPDLSSYITASSMTNIELHYWDGISSGTTVALVMSINGNTPGSYPVDPGYVNSSVMYSSNGIPYDNLLSNTSGTIILSTVGNVGENITGTFDAEVVSLLATNTTDTLRISGSFSITRDN
jgi:hypothetical protein